MRSTSTPEQHRELLSEFLTAAASGDSTGLRDLLTDDAVACSDGGGVKPAAPKPVTGADSVVRLFIGLAEEARSAGDIFVPVPTELNGMPGLLLYLNGRLDSAVSIEVRDERIGAISQCATLRNLARFQKRTLTKNRQVSGAATLPVTGI